MRAESFAPSPAALYPFQKSGSVAFDGVPDQGSILCTVPSTAPIVTRSCLDDVTNLPGRYDGESGCIGGAFASICEADMTIDEVVPVSHLTQMQRQAFCCSVGATMTARSSKRLWGMRGTGSSAMPLWSAQCV